MLNNSNFQEIEDIFNACYDGIYVCDQNLIGIWVNEAFERITGIPIEIWKGTSVHELKDKGLFSKSISLRVLEEKKQATMLQTYQTGKTALVTGTPIFSNNTIEKVVVTARDVTDINQLSRELKRNKLVIEQHQKEIENIKSKENYTSQIIGNSIEMKNTIELAIRISQVDSPVMVSGESGVGKEVIANLIHQASLRSKQPFVTINCGAIPRDLLEAELFGYEAGSFTGAKKNGKPGLFEVADKGTIFLDEIGELPLSLQVKLLRFLQDLKVTRIGGIKTLQLDVKIIAATNRNLEEMVREGTFREDLFYRLSVIPIVIPPLRNRTEDVRIFCNNFLSFFNKKYNKDKYFHHSTIELLERYSWPGNVRELKHLIERLVVTVEEQCLEIEHLPIKYNTHNLSNSYSYSTLKEYIENVEKEIISRELIKHKSANKVAKILGLSQPTISRKMKKYHLL